MVPSHRIREQCVAPEFCKNEQHLVVAQPAKCTCRLACNLQVYYRNHFKLRENYVGCLVSGHAYLQ